MSSEKSNTYPVLFGAVEFDAFADHLRQMLLDGMFPNINFKSQIGHNCGWTALHKAIYCEQLEAAKVLIEFGADVNAKDGNGQTPLYYAGPDKNLAEFLIEHGADVLNTKDNEGKTVLHTFCNEGELDSVPLLMENGGSGLVNVQDNQGNTPLHCAIDWDLRQIFDRILIDKNEKTPLYPVAELLIANGADLNAKNIEGQTVLHKLSIAEAAAGSFSLPDMLMKNGADLNAKDNNGATPARGIGQAPH